jgi:deazaflavin-dependent oxidoreductase (nitroreductase family)
MSEAPLDAQSTVERSDVVPSGGAGRRGPLRRLYGVKQWLYAGGRPRLSARLMNQLSARLYSAGVLSPARAMTLEVVGRRSGRPISFPVVVVDLDGQRYVVSMLGAGANWVRNVRAAAGRAVLVRRGRRQVRLVEVAVGQRAPILRRYLQVAPGARPHVPVDARAPLADFERVAQDFPVFRVDPAATEPSARPGLELVARMTVRPGMRTGFLAQAAECVRSAREQDTDTLRYDWYLSTDGTRCEVRESYGGVAGLVEHRAHVGPALARLFADYADDHAMTVYGDPDPRLVELAERYGMSDAVTWMTRVAGLDDAGPGADPGDPGPRATGLTTPDRRS